MVVMVLCCVREQWAAALVGWAGSACGSPCSPWLAQLTEQGKPPWLTQAAESSRHSHSPFHLGRVLATGAHGVGDGGDVGDALWPWCPRQPPWV